MKYILLAISFLLFYSYSNSQTLLWSDDFESTASDWDLTLTPGTNGADANIWEINDTEGGVTPPGCGAANNGDKTLHVTCSGSICTIMGTGAIYNGGGAPGIDPTTDVRAALINPINTTSETDLEIVFDWIGVGQANQDFTELEYSIDGGTTWNSIWTQIPGNTCGSEQGEWKKETVSLPVATENQPDLRFAFHWVNDNDGAATAPSFAVNNLRLYTNNTPTSGPTVDFKTPNFTICKDDCIDFTDLSTGTNISSWDWTFNGANTPTSSNQNPTNICFPTTGNFDVTLEVTDDNGTNSKTIQVTVNDCSSINADFTAQDFTICMDDCIDFFDISTGTNISSWSWTFAGADTPSSSNQNPTNICFPSAGSFNVTLEITDDNGTDSKTMQVTVNDCSQPGADFTTPSFTICKDDCIDFTDASVGSNISSWNWSFNGGHPSMSTAQNPSDICFDTSGVFNISLVVSNLSGTDQVISPINVLTLPKIIGYGDTLIHMEGSAELVAVPMAPGSVFWDPEDNIDCPTCLNVIASPLISTTYYPSIIDANGCIGQDTVVVLVDFEEIVDVPSAFSPNADGVNDSLHVLGVGIISINFSVYNRYGQLVFSTTNVNEGWDGTMNGKALNQGVFVYTLEYGLINGSHGKKTGNITLIK